MSKKIYLISHLRANPHRLTLLRRGGLAGAIAAALLLGLSSCSPRPPAGGAGAAAASSHASASAAAGGGAHSGAPAKNAVDGARTSAAGGRSSPAASPRAGSPSTAYVSFVTGDVTALAPSPAKTGTAGTPTPKRVHVADNVTAGELITTHKGSAAEIQVGNLFDIGLGEKASLRFDEVGAASSNGSGGRLVLTLGQGALQLKAGAEFVSGGSGLASPPVILEVHTPHLFVSSRGGSLLVTEAVDSTLCAVGRGRAWLLPGSVVYPDIVKTVENPAALRLLDSILSQAVGVGRHEQVAVPGERLAKIGKAGSAIRAILLSTKGQKSYAPATAASFKRLASEAAREVASAIGKPAPLSKELRAELDSRSIYHQKMKTVSSTETGSSKATANPVKQQSGAPTIQPDVAHTPGYTPPASSTTTGSAAGSSSSAAPSTGSSPSSPAAATSSSSASAAKSASSAASAVESLLSNLFGASSASSPSGGTSTNGSAVGAAGGTTTGGQIPGPTPPTPPTAPNVPK